MLRSQQQGQSQGDVCLRRAPGKRRGAPPVQPTQALPFSFSISASLSVLLLAKNHYYINSVHISPTANRLQGETHKRMPKGCNKRMATKQRYPQSKGENGSAHMGEPSGIRGGGGVTNRDHLPFSKRGENNPHRLHIKFQLQADIMVYWYLSSIREACKHKPLWGP